MPKPYESMKDNLSKKMPVKKAKKIAAATFTARRKPAPRTSK